VQWMCNRESIGVCGEVCEQPLWSKERERERGKRNLQLLPIATYVGCFEDPTMKPCLIELQFLLKIYHSYFSNLDGGIVYWRFVEASRSLWRVVVHRKFLLPLVLVVLEIQRRNLLQLLWNFYWSFTTHS